MLPAVITTVSALLIAYFCMRRVYRDFQRHMVTQNYTIPTFSIISTITFMSVGLMGICLIYLYTDSFLSLFPPELASGLRNPDTDNLIEASAAGILRFSPMIFFYFGGLLPRYFYIRWLKQRGFQVDPSFPKALRDVKNTKVYLPGQTNVAVNQPNKQIYVPMQKQNR